MERHYQICVRCVMDTTDPDITFDSAGICCHCHEFESVTKKRWFPNSEGRKILNSIIDKIKLVGKGKDCDCIIGLSGGVDSSYLALKVKDFGLRPLAVHIDAGWNSELAVKNIESIVKYCNYDLYTQVIDWEEMRDLQLAYLRSGIANQDVPQDHIFFASLYHFAVKNGIKYVLSGGNIATESIFPKSWHHSAMDAVSLKAIHKKFGTMRLKRYKTIGFFQYYFYYPFLKGMRLVRPLNFMFYNKKEAMAELKKRVGWREYSRKHCESFFTKFFQNYYLIVRFGYDKRRPHLSSLIVSGQITREEALRELEKPLYDPKELEEDKEYFVKKIGISVGELEAFVKAPSHSYADFPNMDEFYLIMKRSQSLIERFIGKRMSRYS